MFSDGATALTTFQYDAFGNVTRAEDRNGQVKVYAYDELLRLRTELWYDEQGQLANTITRTYDAANRVVDLVDDVSHYTYVYDSLDRVVQETIANPGAPTVVLNTGYGDVGQGYRLDGLRTSSSVEIAGTADYVATFAYNALNQLTEISQAGQGGSAVAGKHVSLTYTDTGLIESVTRYASTDASNLVVIGDYTYDAQGRLTALSYYQDPANPLNEYTWAYDAAGRLIRQTSSDGSADYAYDASGQVTAADYDYQADESYQYDENGNRTSADGAAYQTDEHNRMTSDGAYAYTYDHEGNRTARFLDNDLSGDLSDGDTDITQYAWDAANRLAGVAFRDTYDGPAAKTLTYTYDAYSRLIRKTVDPDGQQGTAALLQTAYVYDGDQIVLQFDHTGTGDVQASDLSHRYLWGPAVDQILADETVGDGGSDDVLWPLTDHQGTVRDLAFYDEADAETSIANHVAYNAFGRKTSETNAAVDCVFAYTGRLLDDDTGLQNHLHRWYDPETAKWLSEDPIGFQAGDANLTRWVGNAGTTGVDPDGLICMPGDAEWVMPDAATMQAEQQAVAELRKYMYDLGVARASLLHSWNEVCHDLKLNTALRRAYEFEFGRFGRSPYDKKLDELGRRLDELQAQLGDVDTNIEQLYKFFLSTPHLAYAAFASNGYLSDFRGTLDLSSLKSFQNSVDEIAFGDAWARQGHAIHETVNPFEFVFVFAGMARFAAAGAKAAVEAGAATTTAESFLPTVSYDVYAFTTVATGRVATTTVYAGLGIDAATGTAILLRSGVGIGATAVTRLAPSAVASGEWQNLLGGVRVKQIGNYWVKEINPEASKFAQWWGRGSLNAQAAGLEQLGDMAPSFLYKNGKLITRDVGQFSGSVSDYLRIWAKGSWRMRTPMNDIRPWNIGANGQIFDPALHPIQQGVYWGGSAIVVGAGGSYFYYSSRAGN